MSLPPSYDDIEQGPLSEPPPYAAIDKQERPLPVRLCGTTCVGLVLSLALPIATFVLAVPTLNDEDGSIRLFSIWAIVFNALAIVMVVGMHLVLANMDARQKTTNIVHSVCYPIVMLLATIEVLVGIGGIAMFTMCIHTCATSLLVVSLMSLVAPMFWIPAMNEQSEISYNH